MMKFSDSKEGMIWKQLFGRMLKINMKIDCGDQLWISILKIQFVDQLWISINSKESQADDLLLYEWNCLWEGSELLVEKESAASSKQKPLPNCQIWVAHSYSAVSINDCFPSILEKLI